MNQMLNEYYMNKGKHPQKLLNELIQLAQDQVHISKAPVCSIKASADGSNQIIQLGNLYSGPLNGSSIP